METTNKFSSRGSNQRAKHLARYFSTFAAVIVSAVAHAQSTGSVDVPRIQAKQVGANDPFAWKVKKTTWSSQDEAEFADFVRSIGNAVESKKCGTVEACMRSKANPFYSSDPSGLAYFSDCADFPYFMRAYFAWKKGLPFSFVSAVEFRDPADADRDARYPKAGLKPSRRTDTVASSKTGRVLFPSALDILGSKGGGRMLLSDSISTGTFRMPVLPNANEPLNDFYPVSMDRSGIKTGTALYGAQGHAALVYRVNKDGSIDLIDAHPGNYLTFTHYGSEMERSRQEHGAIFKAFRPIQLVGATPDDEGNLIGGTVVVSPDSAIRSVSYDQVKKSFGGWDPYYLWLRQHLSGNSTGFKVDVLKSFEDSIAKLCEKVIKRQKAVQVTLQKGVDAKPHPDKLPNNIFGADGEWEDESTPGGDTDLRGLYKQTVDSLKYNVKQLASKNSTFVYKGKNLAQDLFNVYRTGANSCPVSYANSSGNSVTLDLEQIRLRMFLISFDPYDCADLRWGDIELAVKNCGEDVRWYNAEQYLRNLTARDTSAFHGYDINGLEDQNRKLNKKFEYDTNIIGFIQSLAKRTGITLK